MKELAIIILSSCVGGLIGGLFVYNYLSNSVDENTVIRARGLVIVDSDGRDIIQLGKSDVSSGLRLYDKYDKLALDIGISNSRNGRYIRMFGAKGNMTLALNSVPPDGDSTLYLGNERSGMRVALGALPSDVPSYDPVTEWGLTLRQPRGVSHLFALVANEEPGQISSGALLKLVRSDGTEWGSMK